MSIRAGSVLLHLISALLLLAVAYSWLTIPYFIRGDEVLVASSERARAARLQNYLALNRILSRTLQFPGGFKATALYVTDAYNRYLEGIGVEDPQTGAHLIFIIEEHAQHGDLPRGAPEVVLAVKDREYQPVSVESTEAAGLQRKTIVRFPRSDANRFPLVRPDTGRLELKLSNAGDRYAVRSADAVWEWELPLNIPAELQARPTTTVVMLLSMAAGLMSSVLTPCLLQLVVVLLAALGGFSAAAVSSAGAATVEVRRRVTGSAALLALGFVALFALGGYGIGHAGKTAQLAYADYARPAGVLAGAGVILFGLWVGIRSRAPWVCNLPGAGAINNQRSHGRAGALAAAAAIGVGCLSCYGGVIITALLVYAGARITAVDGALVLGAFAAGVALPFLLAVLLFARMRHLLELIGRQAPLIGAISMVLLVGFGLLLATDSYHTVSDWLYPYLGLD
jgi:cytochrome c-type biogenesis protein